MFKINYAIMDTEDEIKTFTPSDCCITGPFEIVVNEKGHGDYSEDEQIRKCPVFFEILPFWFEYLTTIVKEIKKHGYALLDEIESYNTWIEFIYKENDIELSIIRVEKWNECGLLSFERILPPEIEYGEWKKERITFDEFSNEVINAADRSLRTIYSINPTLREVYPWDDRKESYSAQKTKDDSDKKVIPT